jgi:hypothetical protein
VPVPQIIPECEQERFRYEMAKQRREERLRQKKNRLEMQEKGLKLGIL